MEKLREDNRCREKAESTWDPLTLEAYREPMENRRYTDAQQIFTFCLHSIFSHYMLCIFGGVGLLLYILFALFLIAFHCISIACKLNLVSNM